MPNICYFSKYSEICILNSHSSQAVLQKCKLQYIYIYISVGKESACNAGDTEMWVQSLGQEDPLEEENGNSLQYSCLKYPMDRGPCWTTVQRVTKSQTCTHICAFSSVQFSRSVVSDSLRPHESQHTRPPCPLPTPRVHSNSRPSS